jgi:hypothetical protein
LRFSEFVSAYVVDVGFVTPKIRIGPPLKYPIKRVMTMQKVRTGKDMASLKAMHDNDFRAQERVKEVRS